MDLYEAIEKRRTIRKFKSPATEAQLNRIILAGVKAPSPENRQSWEFVIVDDPVLVEKIAVRKFVFNRRDLPVHRGIKPDGKDVTPNLEQMAKLQKDAFFNASLILVFHKAGNPTDAASAWMCIQNMCLASVAEGLAVRIACCPFGGADKDVASYVQAPEGLELAAALSIGVPAQDPAPRKLRPEGEWLHRNHF